jgi:methionyl aminopeptidase
MALSEEVFQKHKRAGKIAAEVREEMRRTVREGMPIIDLCERAESMIRRKGGKPAFPCNVSVNEIAAHYTSPPKDRRTIPEGALVKIDVGVHVDGYIADTAATVCFNPEYESLVHTAEEALEKAVESLRPGLFTAKFGSMVEGVVKARGFKVVSNLTGHKIGRYLIHAGKSLPNVFHISGSRVKLGEVYGVEPFVTLADAAGRVENGPEAHIFRFLKRKSLKNLYAKRMLNYVQKNFRSLPFAERWLQDCVPHEHYGTAFSELLSSKSVMAYPVFVEASRKPVAQAEYTILIVEDGCLVLT